MMAKTVYTPEEVTLEDGLELTIKPLSIAKLKRAMAYLEDSGDDDAEDMNSGLDFILGLTQKCVGHLLPEDYDLEENLDTVTAKRIILVSTGIDFDDQNLMIAAAAGAAQSGAK
jgi:hypothetical protein